MGSARRPATPEVRGQFEEQGNPSGPFAPNGGSPAFVSHRPSPNSYLCDRRYEDGRRLHLIRGRCDLKEPKLCASADWFGPAEEETFTVRSHRAIGCPHGRCPVVTPRLRRLYRLAEVGLELFPSRSSDRLHEPWGPWVSTECSGLGSVPRSDFAVPGLPARPEHRSLRAVRDPPRWAGSWAMQGARLRTSVELTGKDSGTLPEASQDGVLLDELLEAVEFRDRPACRGLSLQVTRDLGDIFDERGRQRSGRPLESALGPASRPPPDRENP